MELTELETNALNECNEILKPFDLTASKVKQRRKSKYCIMKNGVEILCNEDIVHFTKYCKENQASMQLLSDTADHMTNE